MSQSEDMDAINRMMANTPAITNKASDLKDQWVLWWNDLSWWSKSMDLATYDAARNRRDKFNLANTTTEAERKGVEQVMKTGLTSEESRGEVKRKLSSGLFIEEKEPLVPNYVKWSILGVGIASVLIFAYKAPEAVFGRVKQEVSRL